MKAVLICRLSSGETIELCPYGFKWADLKGAEIISGDKYYIDKAAGLGAIPLPTPKPRPKTKS